MIRLAVFGDPVAHSLSPSIHQQFAEHTGLSVDYRAIRASADELTAALDGFYVSGGQGANLTVPHKQAGLSICNSLSQRARTAGAVNTLLREPTGWHGDNTDGLGLLWDLQRQAVQLANSRILIIGAGGATRGIVPILLEQKPARLIIANRTFSTAQQLAECFAQHPVSACCLDDIAQLENIQLMIHASAAGHGGNLPELPELEGSSHPLCYDLSYGAAAQWFIRWADNNNYPSSDGLGMLLGQAAEAFELWTDKTISNAIRTRILTSLRYHH